MKTKLQSLFISMMLFSAASYAQTKTWDFGNDRTTWPESTGITSETIIDNLGLYPISTNTNFGAITASNATFSDGFTGAYRFQMNGGGGVAAPSYLPIQRYMYIDVDSDCQVSVWFKSGSTGSTRTFFVTDGTAVVGSGTSNSGTNADLVMFTANYTSATGGRLYLYGDSSCNIYKITVTGANVTTSFAGVATNKVQPATVFSNGKQAYITNITSETQVNVYAINGTLIKTFSTTQDASFDFLTAGLYVVNLTSAEGQKSVKIVVQ